LPVLLIGGGGLVLLARRRRTPTTTGGGMTGHGTGDRIRSAGAMLRTTVAGGGAPPASPFRVGMTLQADPTPFILAADSTKVRAPEASMRASCSPCRRWGVCAAPGSSSHGSTCPTGGAPSSFTSTPATARTSAASSADRRGDAGDEAEWAVWLDPAEG
jgi:hypothetical protein